eukprot:CAMPEP_0172428448 /NCGR_PEP_ID=MMETSP1064-20121228/46386_1 /TAXON_ID=202472 /ORGANISM="Aulacoseira subarctica , Strain CCAP 1002/5" /LENGTH=86 /DNA_ID=CAMNT_0013173241 /DNA_START=328 /DNA_END=584 /DNA_ORIENTATION=-
MIMSTNKCRLRVMYIVSAGSNWQVVRNEQIDATVLYEDNNGALMMANAQQPTRRTRHMDIKKFALLDWVEQDLLILKSIKTLENAA